MDTNTKAVFYIKVVLLLVLLAAILLFTKTADSLHAGGAGIFHVLPI